jgi:hypothetical protein
VAVDVSNWQLAIDTWDLFHKQLLPTLRPAGSGKLDDVGHVLAELRSYIQHADQRDSPCAQRLILSLQTADASRRAQETDKDLLTQWIRQHRQLATEACDQLELVSSVL